VHPARYLVARTGGLGVLLPPVGASSVQAAPQIRHLGHQHLGPVARLEATRILPTRVAAFLEAISHPGSGTLGKAVHSLVAVVQDLGAQAVLDLEAQPAQLLEERFRHQKELPTLRSLLLPRRIPVLTL
jgi:hypothetical protein